MGLLDIKNLVAGYGAIQVLHGVSLTVHTGQITALLGPNGAGKSTLLKTIMGLVQAREGDVTFSNHKVNHLRTEERVRRGLVMVPEGRGILKEFTVTENLQMGCYLRKDGPQKRSDFERVLEQFPILRSRINQQAGTLSGGEQQMLAFARARLALPKVLLLDEPSMGLAPIVVDAVFEAIKDMKNEGLSILLVEQNARITMEVSDSVFVLENGIVSEEIIKGASADSQLLSAYLGV